MALPGMRGYGREDNWAGGRNSGYRSRTSNQEYGPPTIPMSNQNGFDRSRPVATNQPNSNDPLLGRRLDTIDQRMGQQDAANKSLLEQLMKIQQDFKMELKKQEQTINEERNQRMRLETSLQGAVQKIGELDQRMRGVESSTKENKNALTQLITHTKNIERAVTLSHQEHTEKREQQGNKLQELQLKLAQHGQGKEVLERTTLNVKDQVRELESKMETLQMEVEDFKGAVKLQSVAMDKIHTSRKAKSEENEKEGRMTETQRAMLEAKIMQCQQTILDVAAKLNAERRDRDQDMDQINSRITELIADLTDRDRRREADQREQEAKAREQASLGNAEKQKIIMQISAVQTDIRRSLDERDTKLRDMTVNRLDEMDSKLAEGARQRTQLERDMRALMDAEMQKQQLAAEGGVDTLRKLVETEQDKLRRRIQELSDNLNAIQKNVQDVKSALMDEIIKTDHDAEAKDKVLDAKIEDLSDRLRLGMATMQAAFGEHKGGGGGGGIPMEEVERLQEDAIEGVREAMAKQIGDLEEQIKVMRSDIRKQNEAIAGSLKSQQHAGEEASNILGDKLHQKMDSITFTQERMKRQIDSLQEKISGAPSDIGDLRDRVEDMERNLAKIGSKGGNGEKDQSNRHTGSHSTTTSSDDVKKLRREVDMLLGRDESGEIEGIPSLPRLQSDVEDTASGLQKMQNSLRDLSKKTQEDLDEERGAREQETKGLKKDISRFDKRIKEIKERLKGKLGLNIPDTKGGDDEDNE